MRRSDGALVRHALRESAPLGVLGLLACAGLEFQWLERLADIEVPSHSTWPLLPVVVLAAWAGIAVFGEFRGTMAHALARPLDRGRLLAVRGLVFAAVLASVVVSFRIYAGVSGLEAGPPLAFIVGSAALAFGVGAFAGVSTDSETSAVGATLVGVALTVSPVVMVFDIYAVSWPRVTSVLGLWLWPAALSGAVCLAGPTWWVVRALPHRDPRRVLSGLGAVVVLHLLAFGLVWQPTASRATSSVHGETIAIDGVEGGPRVVFVGSGGKVDGVYVDRGDERVPVYGDGAQRDQIVDAALSPDGEAIALLVRPSQAERSRIVLVDLNSGERVSTGSAPRRRLGVWAPDSRRMAFDVTGERSPIGVVSLHDGTSRVIPPKGKQHYTRLLAWHDRGIVAGSHRTVFLIPDDGEGMPITFETDAGGWAVSTSGLAWVDREGRRGHLGEGKPYRTLKLQGWDPGASPIAVELDAWPTCEISALGFLDPDHVYVQFTRWDSEEGLIRSDSAKKLYIVHRSGEVRAAVDRDEGLRVHNISGPPGGPWLSTGIYGTLHMVGRDGRSLERAQARNLGGRSFRWIPIRDIRGGVAFIEDGGLSTLLTEQFQ